jgi:Cu2+-exporting ATPase
VLADGVRPESQDVVRQLHPADVHIVMITADAQPVAEAVADELGVDHVFAEVLPADKDDSVAQLQRRALLVAMVGDGVNDPALARADVGIAIGTGTDVMIESAGVLLASDDPRGVVAVRRLPQASYRTMWQNLVWATGDNLLSVPLAAGVLAGVGLVLHEPSDDHPPIWGNLIGDRRGAARARQTSITGLISRGDSTWVYGTSTPRDSTAALPSVRPSWSNGR